MYMCIYLHLRRRAPTCGITRESGPSSKKKQEHFHGQASSDVLDILRGILTLDQLPANVQLRRLRGRVDGRLRGARRDRGGVEDGVAVVRQEAVGVGLQSNKIPSAAGRALGRGPTGVTQNERKGKETYRKGGRGDARAAAQRRRHDAAGPFAGSQGEADAYGHER